MDDFSGNDTFDSLRDALEALTFVLAEELHEKDMQIKDALANRNKIKASRAAGEDAVYQYALGMFLDMNNQYSEAGKNIALLCDDPSRLPALMDEVLTQVKAMRDDGRFLKAAMILIPSRVEGIMPDRAAVEKGVDEAIRALDEELFPIFRDASPPPSPPSWRLPEGPLF